MSLPIYQRVAVTDAGDVIPGAEYTVINENTGVAAPIYSDRTGATLLTAPYFADSVGTIQFYIAAGTTFRVAASGGVGTYTDRYIYAAHPQSSPTDTTANALMAVGAFGLGATTVQAAPNNDLNDITVSGDYYGSAGSSANMPSSGISFQVTHNSVSNADFAVQTAIGYGGSVPTDINRMFVRHKDNGVWEAWNEIITADAAGNVGIGTSSPIDNLNIYDSDNNVGLQLQTATTGTTSGDGFRLGINNSEAFLWQYESLPLTFATSGSERMRIDSAGHLLVNTTTAPPFGNVNFGGSFYAAAAIGDESSGIYFGLSGVYPSVGGVLSDNQIDLGNVAYRWDDVYATNGTIQTSDRNEKQDILEITAAETAVATACKGLLRSFRWKDSVAEKGDDARIHFGIIAQDLQGAFTAEGLDAGRYAMFISGTSWETQTEVAAVEAVEGVEFVQAVEASEALYSEDGELVSEAVEAVDGVEGVEAVEAKDAYTRTDTFQTLAEAPAGATERTRLGVRYSELLAFIIAAL